MKRILLIGCVLATFWFLVLFAIQNQFLFAVPFTQKDKTTAREVDNYMGNYCVKITGPMLAPGTSGRIYLLHFYSYVFCEYQMEFHSNSSDLSKGFLESARWKKCMNWGDLGLLDIAAGKRELHTM
jgi:hypothetical protein